MTKGARKELLFAVAKMRDVWYNKFIENLEFQGEI